MNTGSNTEQMRVAKREAARSYLADVRKLQQKAQRAETEYRMAIERSSGLTGIDYSRDQVSKSVSPDAIPNAVIKYEELKEQLDILKAAADEAVDECFDKLYALDDVEGSVVRMHYVLGLSVKDIAVAEGIWASERTVARRLCDGLEHLYDSGIPLQYRINHQQAI